MNPDEPLLLGKRIDPRYPVPVLHQAFELGGSQRFFGLAYINANQYHVHLFSTY